MQLKFVVRLLILQSFDLECISKHFWIHLNNKSYVREKLRGFTRFLTNRDTNSFSSGSTFNIDEAKTMKALDEIQY